MKNALLALIAILTTFICSAAFAANIAVPNSGSIPIKEYFEQPVTVSGVASPVKYEIVTGRLPFGLRLAADGRTIGYPAAVQSTTATIKASNSKGESAQTEITFTVADPAFKLRYSELPVAQIGKTAAIQITGQGGTPPYSGCKIARVRTFTNGGAAKPGAKAPATDSAPAWLKISDDCVLSAAPDSETETLLIISAQDAAGATASEFFALRTAADTTSPGWLEQKAREYNIDYQKRFSPYGLSLEIDGSGAYESYGDSAIWTGTYLAGAAYYYAVTGEEFARHNLDKALAATTKLREITGVPGLIARAYEFDEWKGKRAKPYIQDNPAGNSYVLTDGPYKGWRFISTASRDQYTGVFWGNATVFDLFDDPDFKRRSSENIVSMASHIWDNKMRIMDRDGKRTEHGAMSGYSLQSAEGEGGDPYGTPPTRLANGFNATLVLNWFDMAAAAAPDEQTRKLWRDRYLALTSKQPNPEPGRSFERDYTSFLKRLYVYGEAYNTFWDTAWFNVNLLYNNYFHLIRLEKDPALRDKYRGVLRWLWEDKRPMADGCEFPEKRRSSREKNPHFTWQYLAAQGVREPDRIFDALSELMTFPRGPRGPFKIIDPVNIPSSPAHPGWACESVPVQYRPPSDFQWQRSPYSIGETWRENGGNAPGIDVVTPYWMGRYFGYIPGNL